jgi:NADPH:quinone reductase-like Zn-dependent oxidoreductase
VSAAAASEDLVQGLALAKLAAVGALTAKVAKRFALTDAAAALRYAEAGGTGKVILASNAD